MMMIIDHSSTMKTLIKQINKWKKAIILNLIKREAIYRTSNKKTIFYLGYHWKNAQNPIILQFDFTSHSCINVFHGVDMINEI